MAYGLEKKDRIKYLENSEDDVFIPCIFSIGSQYHFKSDDYIAPLLLPSILKQLLHIPPVRRLFSRVVAPKGIYEYVIVRTKYIDAVFKQALAEQFNQILIFGAGFDTRALRFRDEMRNTLIFEQDTLITPQEKIRQYQKRYLAVPSNVTFVGIDFDKEALPMKLDEAGFRKRQQILFVLEGLLMYLRPESVNATFQTMQNYAGRRSWVIFDYVYASVLRNEGIYYGEMEIAQTVSGAGEQWHFGIEVGEIEQFLATYDLKLISHKNAQELERVYFSDSNGKVVRRVNVTHCLVTAEKWKLVRFRVLLLHIGCT